MDYFRSAIIISDKQSDLSIIIRVYQQNCQISVNFLIIPNINLNSELFVYYKAVCMPNEQISISDSPQNLNSQWISMRYMY